MSQPRVGQSDPAVSTNEARLVSEVKVNISHPMAVAMRPNTEPASELTSHA